MKSISGIASRYLLVQKKRSALTVIGKILGRRATAIYVSGIVICTLGLGLLVDWIYLRTDFMAGALGAWRIGAAEEESGLLGAASAAILLGLVAWKRGEGVVLRIMGGFGWSKSS